LLGNIGRRAAVGPMLGSTSSSPAHSARARFDWDDSGKLSRAGAQIIQLREKKTLGDRELLDRARLVRRFDRFQADALFIMNDRPDLCPLGAEAEMASTIGQDELPVQGRPGRIVGPEALDWKSARTISSKLRQAIFGRAASYVGGGTGRFHPEPRRSMEFPGFRLLVA